MIADFLIDYLPIILFLFISITTWNLYLLLEWVLLFLTIIYIYIFIYLYIFIITYSSALHLFFLNNFSRQKMREIVGSNKAHQELLQVHRDYFTVKHFAGSVSL